MMSLPWETAGFAPVDRGGPWDPETAEALTEGAAPLRTLSDRDRTLLAAGLVGMTAFVCLTLVAGILGDVTRRRLAAIIAASGFVAAGSYWYDRL